MGQALLWSKLGIAVDTDAAPFQRSLALQWFQPLFQQSLDDVPPPARLSYIANRGAAFALGITQTVAATPDRIEERTLSEGWERSLDDITYLADQIDGVAKPHQTLSGI